MITVYCQSKAYLALSISSTLGCSDDDEASSICKASWASILSEAAMRSASRPPSAGEAVAERGVRG